MLSNFSPTIIDMPYLYPCHILLLAEKLSRVPHMICSVAILVPSIASTSVLLVIRSTSRSTTAIKVSGSLYSITTNHDDLIKLST